MGVLTMADLTAFAGYCQAYARWREAEDFITQHGSIFKTPSGYVQQVPQVSIAQQNLKIMQSFATEFGLTPACRARIVASGGAAESDDDGNSEGLSFFGLSESDFVRDQRSAQDWLDGLLAVWSDGEKESNEIVAHWTDSFKTLTASTRDELTALKETADKNGYTSVSQGLAADIQTLDQMDAEITRLLKKRQNGFLTEKEKIRLQELIDTREAIEVKYRLTPEETGGFETIAQKVEAEVARAQARGKTDADTSVYENAVKAAAEGMAAINAQIDERYDKEYGLIQLIEDETERQKALEDLNSRYNEERKTAAQEYAETLASIVMPIWNQPEIQQASQQMDELFTKLREYSMASESEKPALLADLQALSASKDERI